MRKLPIVLLAGTIVTLLTLAVISQFVSPPLPWAQNSPPPLEASPPQPASSQAPMPDSQKLTESLKPILADVGGTAGVAVTDGLTGTSLYEHNSHNPFVPASNVKLLTATSVLDSLDPQERLTTSVLLNPDQRTLVLRAGGDVTLSPDTSQPQDVQGHAGLATLAQETKRKISELKLSGPFTLTVDDTMFTGATLHNDWDSGLEVTGEIGAIYPIGLTAPRTDFGFKPRPRDGALNTAEKFTSALKQAGLPLDGPRRDAEKPGAVSLASVQSATIAEQVCSFLHESDNYLAEVLARLAAIRAGKSGSFDGAEQNTRDSVQKLGVATDGLTLRDNSGLSNRNQVSPQQITQLFYKAQQDTDGNSHYLFEGLPIAGVNGTLKDRFNSPQAHSARGIVRAKTGTLGGAVALSGTLVDRDGRLLFFSFLVNNITPQAGDSKRNVLEQAAAKLVECGCR